MALNMIADSNICRVGLGFIYTVYDRIFGDFPAYRHRICTVNIWFWPTLNNTCPQVKLGKML